MLNESPRTNLPTPSSLQLSSFNLGRVPLAQTEAALSIAKRMRRNGDGEVEDAARAFRLLKGAALFDQSWDDLEGQNDEDQDRQVNAYMDGVAELSSALRSDRDQHCTCGTKGGC